MSNETLEEQVADFYWAADLMRKHQQNGGSNAEEGADMSHALWMLLAIYRNASNKKLLHKVHAFLTDDLHMPENLICQLSMLAPVYVPSPTHAEASA